MDQIYAWVTEEYRVAVSDPTKPNYLHEDMHVGLRTQLVTVNAGTTTATNRSMYSLKRNDLHPC